jgi:transposase InsO family protein
VKHVIAKCRVSERRACRELMQHRTTQRYAPEEDAEEKALVTAMLVIVAKRPRFGCRRVTAVLRREGWRVNKKRVHRLWKQEGLRVRKRVIRRRRLGSSGQGCVRKKAERPHHVWSLDFAHDRTENGRPVKVLAVVDEYTRLGLAVDMRRSITAEGVIAILERLFAEHGMPGHIRSDNGPEFIAKALRDWLGRRGVSPLFIEPGSPWQNGYGESFIGRFRDEVLDVEIFSTLLEGQVVSRDWLRDYNHGRPHGALGHATPVEFAARCARADSASLRLPERSGTIEPALA